jgi:hypothetical protein
MNPLAHAAREAHTGMHEAGSGEGELWRGRINEQESKLQLIRANFLERNLKESLIGQAENALGTNVSTQQKRQSLGAGKTVD